MGIVAEGRSHRFRPCIKSLALSGCAVSWFLVTKSSSAASKIAPLASQILAQCSTPHTSQHTTGNQGLFALKQGHVASVKGGKKNGKKKMTLSADAIFGASLVNGREVGVGVGWFTKGLAGMLLQALATNPHPILASAVQ